VPSGSSEAGQSRPLGFQLRMQSLVTWVFGRPNLFGRNLSVQLQHVEGSEVWLIHTPTLPEPTYAKVSKGDRVFFVRVNNSTRALDGHDLISYVKQRWG